MNSSNIDDDHSTELELEWRSDVARNRISDRLQRQQIAQCSIEVNSSKYESLVKKFQAHEKREPDQMKRVRVEVVQIRFVIEAYWLNSKLECN